MGWVNTKLDALYRAFFPDAKDVTPDYWEWLRWRLTQVGGAAVAVGRGRDI